MNNGSSSCLLKNIMIYHQIIDYDMKGLIILLCRPHFRVAIIFIVTPNTLKNKWQKCRKKV